MIARGAALVLVFMACIAAFNSADADENVFYNITSIHAEQLSNGVRVVISADGAIEFYFSKWRNTEYYDWDLFARNGSKWSEDCLKFSKVIGMNLPNARSKVGNFVPIGMYPVDYVELTPVSGEEDINVAGLDIVVHLYTGARMRLVMSEGYTDYNAGTYVDQSQHFAVVPNSGKRSVNVIVTSNLFPVSFEKRSLEGVPEGEQNLHVSWTEGRLGVRVRNARLADLVRQVAAASGRKLDVDPSVDRLVTAELPAVSVDEFVQRICQCYGLTTFGSPPDCLIMREMAVLSSGSRDRQDIQLIPVRWLLAEDAMRMLPNFLLRYTKVDKDNNQLVFSGSPEVADRIRADLTVIDRPSKVIHIKASLIELTSSVDMDTALGLGYQGRDASASVGLPNVTFHMSKTDMAQSEFDAQLSALVAAGSVRVVSSAMLNVMPGQTGEISAGVDKYIQVNNVEEGMDTVIPVTAGMKLIVKPKLTGKLVLMEMSSEVSSLRTVDPVTNLPILDTRKTSGTLQIQPGETIVVGGLEQKQKHGTRRRLPLLGALPIVGSFFSEAVKSDEHARVILLLKPEVLEKTDAIHSL